MNALRAEYASFTQNVSDQAILGWLVMYSVEDFDPGITPADLEKLFNDFSIPNKYMPRAPRRSMAFKRATHEFRREFPQADGNTISYFARDVQTCGSILQRHIVREVRNPAQQSLSWSTAIDAVFDQTGGGEGVLRLTPDTGGSIFELSRHAQMVADLDQRFGELAEHVDSQKVRSLIRDVVRDLQASVVKASSYFVPRTHGLELEALAGFVRALPGHCRMYLVPLVDVEDMREMVIEAFKEESDEALSKIITDCAALRADSKSLTPSAFAALKSEFDSIQSRATAYVTELEIAQDLTLARAEFAAESLAGVARLLLDR